ncbi:LysM domain-containing protein [Seiridium cupressi]
MYIKTFSFSLALALLPALGSTQYLVDPPTTAAPDTIQDCTYWEVTASNDTCTNISENWCITLAQFYTYNPSLGDGSDLIVGNSYCIEQNWGIPPPTPTLTSSSVISTTQAPIPTPTTILEACETEASGYASYCPLCVYRCEASSAVDMCFYNVRTALESMFDEIP